MGIYARHNAEWYRVDECGGAGELPGLGGWATITDVKGKGNKYSYGDWVAFEWTADGELTTQAGGLVDALLVSGGGAKDTRAASGSVGSEGSGGVVREGIFRVETSNDVIVGAGANPVAGQTASAGGASSLGSVLTGKAGAGIYISPGGSDITSTYTTSSITGTPLVVGGFTGTYGRAGASSGSGGPGVVIVRVPKANYMGNLPDGAFDIPTTRQAVVEALEEKVEEAKEAVRDRRKRR